jgi:hypothetical protein
MRIGFDLGDKNRTNRLPWSPFIVEGFVIVPAVAGKAAEIDR